MSTDELPIPGSIVMLDVSREKHDDHQIVLSPVPSNDANDPLRWAKQRKQIHNMLLVLCKWA